MSHHKDIENFGHEEAGRMQRPVRRTPGGLRPNHMSEYELIEHARNIQACNPTLLDALEVFYMNGFTDEQGGSVDENYHYYRVHRWIVTTDSQGFKEVETYDSEREAIDAFLAHERENREWRNT